MFSILIITAFYPSETFKAYRQYVILGCNVVIIACEIYTILSKDKYSQLVDVPSGITFPKENGEN
jgi:hypothetical protein